METDEACNEGQAYNEEALLAAQLRWYSKCGNKQGQKSSRCLRKQRGAVMLSHSCKLLSWH